MFFWYLAIAFLYVPFGEHVQEELIKRDLGSFVPPWGWRPNKIRLDEAFVTPMVATAAINAILDTFLPSFLAKLALKAKHRRRVLNNKIDIHQVVHAAKALNLFHLDSLELVKKIHTPRQDESKEESNDTTPSNNCSPAFEFFKEVEQSIQSSQEVAENFHFYNQTPDENKYDAAEIITQSVLPKFDTNDEYLALVLQLGYICMFTSAW
eukprot:CAMPEP_0203788442 /NCGR_PEP_ID=MMETSP0100_2-20121128/2852_1 /ASSEMBLY_ACC=CAM_ASM_000210 /TAXON_ID=96639 /ORGANISM=" , Strain NY0313808BC1" /LENGTH=208 /DNA_ID=CAMNT_0050691191 /DNA_START=42 /DNA_END=665 /DNA_ORIENTATION=+